MKMEIKFKINKPIDFIVVVVPIFYDIDYKHDFYCKLKWSNKTTWSKI